MPTLLVAAADQGFVYQLVKWFGGDDTTAARLQALLIRPLMVVAILVVALLVSRLGDRVARRLLAAAEARAAQRSGSHRTAPRVATIGRLVAGTWSIAVWVVAVLIILGTLGINLTPLLAGATVVGAALGFGAQSVVRDTLAGFFIVVEDQYGIGDTIQVGDTTGVVEQVSLRATHLRAADGTVWHVANGEIRKVGNTSIRWARAQVDVTVPVGSDLAQALGLLEEEASAMGSDPDWNRACLDPPQVLGVEAMDADGVTLRMVVRTPVGRRDEVGRELRGRAVGRLSREGILGRSA